MTDPRFIGKIMATSVPEGILSPTAVMPYPRLIPNLTSFRDEHGAIVKAALDQDPADYVTVKDHEPLVLMAGQALVVIERLLAQNAAMTEALKNRIMVALQAAKNPPWVPTHRHYKGTLYRVVGKTNNAEHEELQEMVEYDDEEGNKFVLPTRKWESQLDSGKPRYEFIYQEGRG